MSVLNALLAVDGSPAVLQYLAELGLPLAPSFRSRFASEDEVERAVHRLRGHALLPSDERPGARRFTRMLQKGTTPVAALQFASRADAPAVLAGVQGDPCLPLLRLLAREIGPLVMLMQAKTPIVISG